jgi:hypothetical protein
MGKPEPFVAPVLVGESGETVRGFHSAFPRPYILPSFVDPNLFTDKASVAGFWSLRKVAQQEANLPQQLVPRAKQLALFGGSHPVSQRVRNQAPFRVSQFDGWHLLNPPRESATLCTIKTRLSLPVLSDGIGQGLVIRFPHVQELPTGIVLTGGRQRSRYYDWTAIKSHLVSPVSVDPIVKLERDIDAAMQTEHEADNQHSHNLVPSFTGQRTLASVGGPNPCGTIWSLA